MIFFYLCATAVVFTLQLISTGVAAPVPGGNGPWVDPCNSESASSLSRSQRGSFPPSLPEEVWSVKRISLEGRNLADAIMLAIKGRISSDLRSYLDAHPPLEGFPSTGVSFTPGMQIGDMLMIEIERLSMIGVFLEGARLDTRSYTDNIRRLEQNNVDMLCKLHTMLPDRSVTADVSRDIMLTDWRNLTDTTEIDGRNYIIARDVGKILLAIEEGAEAYKKEHNL